jgi:apolipoprotein N-acyltransferase
MSKRNRLHKPDLRVSNGVCQRTFCLALASSLLLYASFPPLGLSLLVWIAPLCWLLLIQQISWNGSLRVWLSLWSASVVHWLLLLEGIRKAHWANYIGWFALAAYLSLYLPVFIWLTRTAVHRLRIPLPLAAPVIWVGLELARGHLITGFSMALLGHALVEWTPLIQVADLAGAYGVSFAIMSVCACVTCCLPVTQPKWRLGPALVALAIVGGVSGYGGYRLSRESNPASGPPLKVALLQMTFDKVFDFDAERNRRTYQQYLALAQEARDRAPDLDLIVWPESVFTANTPDLLVEGEPEPPAGSALSPGEFGARIRQGISAFQAKAWHAAAQVNQVTRDGQPAMLNIQQLVGTETVLVRGPRLHNYNSALLISPTGDVVQRYYKMHPVMFGEYVPFGDVIPWLYRLTPLPQGLSRGQSAQAFQVCRQSLAPSICFESSVPHLIRNHVRELTECGMEPDVLVNVSDDGWFWGASILDHQLAGAVFRAVELRRPFLVAANAGLSAYIDARGRIVARGPRRADTILFANVPREKRPTLYLAWGDLPAGLCLVACLLVAVWAILGRRRQAHEDQPPDTPPATC